MKRIAIVIGIMGNGGAERVIAALANSWIKQDIKVRIITIYGARQDYSLEQDIEIVPISCKTKIRLLRPIERIKEIKNAITDFNADYVISFLADVNIHTILACRNLTIPLIVSERNDPNNDPKQKWIRKLRNKMYSKVNGIVFQTEDAANYFASFLKDNTLTKIIPNPITDGLPYHKYDRLNKRLITACRLNKQKNLKLMIDAVSGVIDKGVECSLDIYGEGPLKEQLQMYIDELGMSDVIYLKGFSKNIHDEMSQSAAFLISSDYEGISNSMLEALAIGVPVIATDCPVGGARMYITNYVNGHLVPVGNVNAFKNAIIDVLKNRDKAEKMAQNATNIRNELNVRQITEMWNCFIQEVNGEFRI